MYAVPKMPLFCKIHRWSAGPYPVGGPVTPSTTVACQLRCLKTALLVSESVSAQPVLALLVVKGTDLRGNGPSNNGDLVEVPAGSGRWYECLAVDDVAKGFSNEYRIGVMSQMNGAPNMWTYPLS